MSAYIEYENYLDQSETDAPGRTFPKYSHKIIKYAVLPRKIAVEHAMGAFKVLVNQGKIVGYQKSEALEFTWVLPPVSSAEEKLLHELEVQIGEALENGALSISMLDDQERGELKAHMALTAAQASAVQASAVQANEDDADDRETAEVVFLDVRRSIGEKITGNTTPPENAPLKLAGDTLKPAAVGSPIINTFFDSLKGKVKFACYVDRISGKKVVMGISGALSESVCESLSSAIEDWSKATSDVLSGEAKMVITGAASGGNAVLVLASDSNYCVIAEAEVHQFGMLVGLWDKARIIKSNAT